MKFLLFFIAFITAVAIFAFGLEESGMFSKRPDEIQIYDPQNRQHQAVAAPLQAVERYIRATDPSRAQPELVSTIASFQASLARVPNEADRLAQGQTLDRALAIGSDAAKVFNQFAESAAQDAIVLQAAKPLEGATAFFFINGIGMHLVEAVRTTVTLGEALRAKGVMGPADGLYLLYNPTRGAIIDSAEFGLQFSQEAMMRSDWGRSLLNVLPPERWPLSGETLTMKRSLERTLSQGFKHVVLIGHSQGAYYAHQLHAMVAKTRADGSGVTSVLLGAVTTRPAVKGTHITLADDAVVNWVRRTLPGGDAVLPANVLVNPGPVHSDSSLHLARQTYFSLPETTEAMAMSIRESL